MHWFSPRCMPHGKERRQQVALTNRGELIPCCWMDQKEVVTTPEVQKLLRVSRIKDYDKVEDILETKEWQEFANNLAEKNMDKVLPVCKQHCRVREGRDRLKKEDYHYKGYSKEIRNEKYGELPSEKKTDS